MDIEVCADILPSSPNHGDSTVLYIRPDYLFLWYPVVENKDGVRTSSHKPN